MTIKLTPDQHRSICHSAERCGVSPTEYARSIVLQATSRQPSEGYLRIREPDGTTN